MKRVVGPAALCVALGMPGTASEVGAPLGGDQAEALLPGYAAPGATRAALRALSYRAFGTFGLTPDRMGPAGCGYHAMLDTVAYGAERAGLGGALRRGIVIAGGAMDVRAQLCPATTVLSQRLEDVGFDAAERLNLAICQEPGDG